MRSLALALVLAACKAQQTAAPAATPPASTLEQCVDAQLAAKGLNEYGDPPDTMYAGGTPLFNEKTGERRDRVQSVLEKRPDIAKACSGK